MEHMTRNRRSDRSILHAPVTVAFEDVRDHHLEFIIGESASVDRSFQFGYDDLDELWANLGEETPKKTGPTRWTGGDAMPRLTTLFTLSAMAPLMASPLRAEHAKINLEVATLHNNVSAFADQTPPQWGKNPRPILTAKVNEPLRIQFLITNVYPHKTLENVVVHFYIARQKKSWAKRTPRLEGGDDHRNGVRHGFQTGRQGRPEKLSQNRCARSVLDPPRDTEHAKRPRAFRGNRPGRWRRSQARVAAHIAAIGGVNAHEIGLL